MTSNLLANAYLALAALAPTSATAPLSHVHAGHDTGTPKPPRHVVRAEPVALTPMSTRVRAERANGRVSLTFV